MVLVVALIEGVAPVLLLLLVVAGVRVDGGGGGRGGVSERVPRRVIARKHFHSAESAAKLILGSIASYIEIAGGGGDEFLMVFTPTKKTSLEKAGWERAASLRLKLTRGGGDTTAAAAEGGRLNKEVERQQRGGTTTTFRRKGDLRR